VNPTRTSAGTGAHCASIWGPFTPDRSKPDRRSRTDGGPQHHERQRHEQRTGTQSAGGRRGDPEPQLESKSSRRSGRAATLQEVVEWNAQQDDGGADQRVARLVGKREDQ
jgi:hypothetical protein